MKIRVTTTFVACFLASNAFAVDELNSMQESMDKLEQQAQELVESSEQMLEDGSNMVDETVEEVEQEIIEQADEVIPEPAKCPQEVNQAVFDSITAPGHILSEVYSMQIEHQQKLEADPTFKDSEEYKDDMMVINKIKEMMKPTKLGFNCKSTNCENDETLEFAYSFDLAMFPGCNNYTYNVEIKLVDKADITLMMTPANPEQREDECEADNSHVIIPINQAERKACIQEWGETIYILHDIVKE